MSRIITHDYDFIKASVSETKIKYVDECLATHGQKTLSIYLFTCCFNEEKLIPFFLKHYDSFIDKFIIMDGGSTDKSLYFLEKNPKVEIISKPNNKLNDFELMQFRNEYYKQYKYDADFCIVCDMDEFLYHPNLLEKLQQYKEQRITIPRIQGFQMVSDVSLSDIDPNKNNLYNIIKAGYADPEHLNKSIIFNPQQVEINYEMGMHKCNPKGNIIYSNDHLKLLHFKYVDYEYFIKRSKEAADRLSDENKKYNLGFHYAQHAQMSKEEFIILMNKCENVIDGDDNTINPLLNRQDLKNQHDSVFTEIVEQNQYKICKKDLMGKNIIDLGANNGIFSLLAESWQANKIIAVEANPEAFKLLQNNANNTEIIPINKAIHSNSQDKVRIDNTSGFCPHDGRHHTLLDANGNVETISLNDVIDQIDDGTDIVMKSDCEGAEYQAIFGADINKLRKCKTILIEMHEDILHLIGKKGLIDKLRNYLISIGYSEKWKTNYVDTKVMLFRFDLERELDNDISVIISAYLKPELLQNQIECFRNQTLKPKEIIVWQTKPNKDFTINVPDDVKLIITDNDFGINSRFSIPFMLNSNYIFSTDDDIFPAPGFLEEAYKISKIENGVISPYGIDYKNGKYNDMESNRYGDHGIRNEVAKKVDVGGHGFFGKREWFKLFWKEEPQDNSISDDIHFSCMLQKYSNINIYVSPYPENNKNIWGNINSNAGMGFRALHTRKIEDVDIWKDINKTSWTDKDVPYLSNNLNKFCEKREQIVKKYIEDLNKVVIEKKEESKKINMDVSVVIPTKDRYFSTLPLTLISVINQTHKPKEIFIIDDSDKGMDLRNVPIYQYIFNLLRFKNIYWEIIFGEKRGQHISHQIGLDRAKSPFVFRIDDDEILEHNTLEELVKEMKDGIGCVAGLVLDPNHTQFAQPGYVNYNKIEDINTRENTQWIYQNPGNVFEVGHLYSSFLYRKVSDIGYCMELSPASHREETLVSFEYVRKGYKLLVNTSAITWHFRNPEGGIRSHAAHPEYWSQDDEIFKRKLKNWNVGGFEGKKMIVRNDGIGDSIVFLKILPELIKKYPKLIIGTFYPFLFKDFPQIELVHAFTALDIKGEKLAEMEDSVYKHLWDEILNKKRKIDLLTAFKEMYLGGE